MFEMTTTSAIFIQLEWNERRHFVNIRICSLIETLFLIMHSWQTKNKTKRNPVAVAFVFAFTFARTKHEADGQLFLAGLALNYFVNSM